VQVAIQPGRLRRQRDEFRGHLIKEVGVPSRDDVLVVLDGILTDRNFQGRLDFVGGNGHHI